MGFALRRSVARPQRSADRKPEPANPPGPWTAEEMIETLELLALRWLAERDEQPAKRAVFQQLADLARATARQLRGED